MSDSVDSLTLDLLEWIGPDPRPYAEVLASWRTSCPQLPVWEDANDRGFITRHQEPGRGALESVSAAGVEHLRNSVVGGSAIAIAAHPVHRSLDQRRPTDPGVRRTAPFTFVDGVEKAIAAARSSPTTGSSTSLPVRSAARRSSSG